ncbi:type 2 lanthipeptide synthetase LanM family protein [Xylanimonas allomyrinae]|nr:type 2 lanthipeptide synthetase LanM family protein [Xylanimonas allomyrinae]
MTASVRELFPEITADDDLAALFDGVGLGVAQDDRAARGLDRIARVPAEAFVAPAVADADLTAFAVTATSASVTRLEAVFATSARTREHAAALAQARYRHLVERVHTASLRTLVAVLHALRDRGVLQGATTEERYAAFCALGHHAPFQAAVRDAFPGLAAQVDDAVETTLTATAQLVDRLDAAVADGVLAGLLPPAPVVVRVDGPEGDLHAGGQGVMIVTFASGERLVYKPRSLAAEAGLAELIRRCGTHAGTRIDALRTVDRGDHGWQEFADGAERTPGPAFFQACGELLAVLHLVRASDMHFENVLVHRGLPVAIDAESLFSANERAGDGGRRPAARALADSVLSTGLLPSRVDLDASGKLSAELGFLGANPGFPPVTAQDVLLAPGTDQLRLRGVDQRLPEPARAVADVVSRAELDALTDGFERTYTWVVTHRETVRSWLVELFHGVRVRTVLQNTWAYTRLLGLATHPRFLEAPALRRALLHRTAIGRVTHFSAAAVRAEIADLERGDVPYFGLRTDDTGLYHWDGTRLADVLASAPLDRALRGLDEMSPAVRRRHTRAIRASFVDRLAPDDDRPTWPHRAAPPATPRARHRAVRDVVARIAGDLADTAARGTAGTPTGWVGATITDTSRPDPWRVTMLGDELYAGATGIGYFLAAAGTSLDDESLVDLAESHLLVRAHELLDDDVRRRAAVTGGVTGGYPGIAYALVNGGRLTGRSEWTTAGLALWRALETDLVDLTSDDFLAGTTGVFAALRGLADAPWLPAADRGPVERLRDRALAAVVAATATLQDEPLVYSGFAHGLAGTGAALAPYARRDPAAARALAQAGAARSRFGADPWAISTQNPQRAFGWCHGTPGLLLSHIVRAEHGGDDGDGGATIDALVQTVQATAFELNLSLCHGDVGNLVILRRAALHTGDDELLDLVASRTDHLTLTLPGRLDAGIGKSVQNSSLMVGQAGIGFGLLLLDAQAEVPNVLEHEIAR